uniref:Uncharacterized protein n=1 Tax=Anopheles atroparvus TaxID=41427 RepID=A0AAG5DG00_ANOAO
MDASESISSPLGEVACKTSYFCFTLASGP